MIIIAATYPEFGPPSTTEKQKMSIMHVILNAKIVIYFNLLL